MRKTLIGLLLICLVATGVITHIIRQRQVAARCALNLVHIHLAKTQAALENGYYNTSTEVSTRDLIAYLRGMYGITEIPSCPGGGRYTLNIVADWPTCSIHGNPGPDCDWGTGYPSRLLRNIRAKLAERNLRYDPDALTVSNNCAQLRLYGASRNDLLLLSGIPLYELDLHPFTESSLDGVQNIRTLRRIDFDGCAPCDLSALGGMDLEFVSIKDCPNIVDLSPLQNARLKELHLLRTGVSDLSPLKGQPIETLLVANNPITDLSPLANMTSLRTLDASDTKVMDISPLQHSRLVELRLSKTLVSDLSPLKGQPLEKLFIYGTRVTDLLPIAQMTSLRNITFNPETVTSGVDEVLSLPNLSRDCAVYVRWFNAQRLQRKTEPPPSPRTRSPERRDER